MADSGKKSLRVSSVQCRHACTGATALHGGNQEHTTPVRAWEEVESVKMYFEAYMRDNRFSPDDARSLRDAQARASATPSWLPM
ncbi:hypothetical protein PF005_g31518 [Phytophthora fragariae]|uniref:Uncharacterized protein n=1 Tax=Phytophthora fragariae TaxID=53985 RepID=A0A6A3VH45_9STRA|nr:hypothetical protein PF009_g31589 [Phytophthora fragariae]KAE9057938.1 hypothetical protein PF010_g31183 [Phytophthora fragariae]KAE9058915.1 hypothetical protein PF007_g31126 [Phytophthora fragariae]KAE9061591.1 hypothetical protein PF006_g31358 [Phytophthora fragariae]KAE9160748.1 hypothetical protein PF005_g31518 [Phytophthora fragariae]